VVIGRSLGKKCGAENNQAEPPRSDQPLSGSWKVDFSAVVPVTARVEGGQTRARTSAQGGLRTYKYRLGTPASHAIPNLLRPPGVHPSETLQHGYALPCVRKPFELCMELAQGCDGRHGPVRSGR